MAKGNKNNTIYPNLSITYNKNPNRFYAVPILGLLAKIIMLIPVSIEAIFVWIAFIILIIINAFFVLITGRYWDFAYNYFVGVMSFMVKISAYVYGLTDLYPWFTLKGNRDIQVSIVKPSKPNRWFAFPLFGFLVRILLLIPFYFFTRIMEYGSYVAMLISWVPVLFQGRLPESTYEFQSDTLRLMQSMFCFLTGLSDSYPSFSISMKHKNIKIALIIAGVLIVLFGFFGGRNQNRRNMSNNYYNSSYNTGY